MSWLFFMDESGHDQKQCPYEVRGGIAIHAGKLWNFAQSMRRLELQAFGCQFSSFGKELKGSTLLDQKRFKFSKQGEMMQDQERQKHARSFLEKTHRNKTPSREEFTAYGQACICMAQGIFQVMNFNDAVIFASIIPSGTEKPDKKLFHEYLRKDHVFLLERFYYLLDSRQEYGLMVMDEFEKHEDRRFTKRIESYYSKTTKGQHRANWIVPSPFFVASDMVYAIQAADVCIYAINWGYRTGRMEKATRPEINEISEHWLKKLQYKGTAEDGKHPVYGIVYVPDPYSPRT
jgi:hypothetical protein